MSNLDTVHEDGEVCDDIRINYMDEYLHNLKQPLWRTFRYWVISTGH